VGVDLAEQAFRVALGLPMTADKGYLEHKKYWFCNLSPPQSLELFRHSWFERSGRHGRCTRFDARQRSGDVVLEPPAGFDVMGWIVGQGDSYTEASESAEVAMEKLDVQVIHLIRSRRLEKASARAVFSSAYVLRRKLLARAKIEKLRHMDIKDLRKLHVGVLGNLYKDTSSTSDRSEIANELMSVGAEIQTVLRDRGTG